jgi:hypothetical protein
VQWNFLLLTRLDRSENEKSKEKLFFPFHLPYVCSFVSSSECSGMAGRKIFYVTANK